MQNPMLYVRKWNAIPPMCCSRLETQLQNTDRRQLNVTEQKFVVNSMPYRGANIRIAHVSRKPIPPSVSQRPTSFRDQTNSEETKSTQWSTKAVSQSWAKPRANPMKEGIKRQGE